MIAASASLTCLRPRTFKKKSVSVRKDEVPTGFASAPRAIGDQGITLALGQLKTDLVTLRQFPNKREASHVLPLCKGDYSSFAYWRTSSSLSFLRHVAFQGIDKCTSTKRRYSGPCPSEPDLTLTWMRGFTMECLHRFLTRSVVIVAMDLEHVNVIRSETLKTCVDCFKDVLPTQSCVSYFDNCHAFLVDIIPSISLFRFESAGSRIIEIRKVAFS